MAELTGTPIITAYNTTTTDSTQRHILGTVARDSAGNEYRYVKFTVANYAGGWVLLDGDWNAPRVLLNDRGAIGICTATAAVNDYGWALVYGVYSAAQITDSEATSAYGLLGPSGVTTEPALITTSSLLTSVVSGPMNNPVMGARVCGVASTATTGSSSNFSGVTVQVFLNYPYLTGMTLERCGTS